MMLCKFVVFCTGFVLAASTVEAKDAEKYVTAAGFLVSVLDGCCRQTEWDEGTKLKAWRKEVVNEVFFDELEQNDDASFFEKANSLSLMIDYCEEKCDKDYICNAFEVQQFRLNEHERLNAVQKATLRRDIREKMWTCKTHEGLPDHATMEFRSCRLAKCFTNKKAITCSRPTSGVESVDFNGESDATIPWFDVNLSCKVGHTGTVATSACSVAPGAVPAMNAGPYSIDHDCAPVPCPAGTTGTSVPDGCTCDNGGMELTKTATAPFYSIPSGCANIPTPAPTPAPTYGPCAAGQFRSSSSINDDGTCEECPDGTYNTVGGYAAECVAYTACPSAYYRKAVPKDQQPVCVKCAAGTYKSLGSEDSWADMCQAYTVCNVETQWFDESAETVQFLTGEGNQIDRACFEHADTTCNADTSIEYEDAEPTPTSARICAQTSTCQDGVQYESSPPNPTTDRGCLAYTAPVCVAPFTYESTSRGPVTDRVCNATTMCADEFYVSAVPTTTTDTECTAYSPCDDATQITVEADSSTWVLVQNRKFPPADVTCTPRSICDAIFDDPTKEVSTPMQQVCVPYPTNPYVLMYPFDFETEFSTTEEQFSTDDPLAWKALMEFFAYDSTDASWVAAKSLKDGQDFWTVPKPTIHMKPVDGTKVFTLEEGIITAAEAAEAASSLTAGQTNLWVEGQTKYTYTVEVYFGPGITGRRRDVSGTQSRRDQFEEAFGGGKGIFRFP